MAWGNVLAILRCPVADDNTRRPAALPEITCILQQIIVCKTCPNNQNYKNDNPLVVIAG
jgi:hypothetical protein